MGDIDPAFLGMSHALEVVPEQLAFAVSEKVAEGVVDTEVPAVQLLEGHPDPGVLEAAPEALLALSQFLLGLLTRRDVGVGRHEPSIRHRVAPYLEHGAVGAGPLEAVRLEPSRQRDPLGDLLGGVARPVLAPLGVVAEELRQRLADHEELARKPQQVERADLPPKKRRSWSNTAIPWPMFSSVVWSRIDCSASSRRPRAASS